MKNISFSEKLVKLKEKIAERTSEIDKSKGRLSMLQDNLKKLGFKNIDRAKIKLKEIQVDLEKKTKSFEIEVKKLERKIEDSSDLNLSDEKLFIKKRKR